ncbi:MAG TPA: substrate-binding domain-containing protein [Roseiflexaceae bacterium]|nr:substrate-binding domain-containing protein [Roseiflexaceae bacterium]
MRVVCMLALVLLIAIPPASCGIPGTAAPTPTPIIIIASPTPGAAPTAPAIQPPLAPTSSPSTTPAASPLPTEAATVSPQVTAPAASAPQLQLSQATLIGIFRGAITSWDDAHIQTDNPGVALPKLPIRVLYRSDPSGTTRAITEYFVDVDEWWKANIGAAYRLGDAGSKPWPVGQGTNDSSQLAKAVKATPGAIGYVAPSYAQSEQLPLAILSNAAGNWVSPSPSTLNEAATNTVGNLDRRLRGFIVNASGPNAYPLAIYTWMLSCPQGFRVEQGQALADFLYWAITDPQAAAAARQLGYEPIPTVIRDQAIAELTTLKIDNQPIFAAPATGQTFKPRHFESPIVLSGSGGTFPNPLYQELIKRYQQVEPSVMLTYNAAGSTQGRVDLLQAGIVQFAGSDEAVVDGDAQITRAVCLPAPLHIPMVVGAVGIVYNLPPSS